MTRSRLWIVTGVVVADAALFLIVGSAMWRDAPSGADEAVGKGLVALGVGLAIPALVLIFALLELSDPRPARRQVSERGRSDWDTV